MSELQQIPPAAVVVFAEIGDWDHWKAQFDTGVQLRSEYGFLGHHINRSDENPNKVGVYLAIGDLDKARAYFTSSEVKQRMAGSGVKGPPTVMWLRPVKEDIVWQGEHPSMLVVGRIRDFDAWLEVYDAADDLRAQGGIVGSAVNRLLDDPNGIAVYHQGRSMDELKALATSPELKAAMERSGITGPPEVSFHTGGWAARYA